MWAGPRAYHTQRQGKFHVPFSMLPIYLTKFCRFSIHLPLDMAVKPVEAKHVPKSELEAVAAQLKLRAPVDVLVFWDQRLSLPSAFVQMEESKNSIDFSSLLPASEHHVVHRTSRLILRFGSIRGTPVAVSFLPATAPGCSIRIGKELAAVVRACSLAGCKRVLSFTLGDIMIPNSGFGAVKYSPFPLTCSVVFRCFSLFSVS